MKIETMRRVFQPDSKQKRRQRIARKIAEKGQYITHNSSLFR